MVRERVASVLPVYATLPGPLSQRGQVPELDGPVPAARRELFTIRAERHAFNPARVAVKRVHNLAGGHVPDADDRIVAGGGQVPTVGVERHGPDPACVS